MIHKDPVCGMQIGEDDAAATAEAGGRTYYFCSTACQQKFDENPTSYTTRSTAAGGMGGSE